MLPWILALHVIGAVCWFAGIFYLPRLFVYHCGAEDEISVDRFKIMEHRLYYGIIWPAAIWTTVFGVWLLSYNLEGYMHDAWMHVKLTAVVLLWIYQWSCGHFLKQFKCGQNHHSAFFYRVFNEVPTLLLVIIVIMVIVKPF